MALRLFNTLTRKKEDFNPIEKGKVRMYNCGPTIYNYPHIGNYRAYLFADLIRRYLKYKGFEVKQVMNLTDVDDKTIRDSQKQGKSLKEFTDFYSKAFFADLDILGIDKAEIYPKATEHINKMLELIKILMDKGYAYKGDDNSIYYRISKFKEYGKLAHIDMKGMKSGARVKQDEYEKESASDFALWKAWDADDGDVFWESEFGKGRPGWHIECSAMAMKYLGDTFDIHTGGTDNMFPHHENEIAQSEAATGKRFVNYWMHCSHLVINGEKMSKSLGNFFTLRDLIDKGYEARAIRFELLSTHYRSQLDFREENLKKIPATLQKFYDFLDRLDEIIKEDNPDLRTEKNRNDNINNFAEESDNEVNDMIHLAKSQFENAMDDDLNISGGLAAIFVFMSNINATIDVIDSINAKKVKEAMLGFDSVLGVMQHEKADIPAEILEKAEMREKARKQKDFAEADKIRDELKEMGYVIEDTSKGPRVKVI
ncbi:MAG: cysteine--tRNA ligase [Nanoarchaeota archaeon]|nr:cysteine--tRNA ligase [Nanoarchaeota archaeon]